MRFVLYTLLGIFCVAIGGIVFLLVAAPTGFIRDQLISVVEAQTGRDLEIAGSVSISVYPNVAVELNDVTLSNPQDMDGGTFVRMEQLRLEVPVLPLLQRKVNVDRFVLVRPVFDLRSTRDGRNNWTFASAGPAVGGNGSRGLTRVAQASDWQTQTDALPTELQDFNNNRTDGTAASGQYRAVQSGGSDGGSAGGGSLDLAGLRLGDVQIIEGRLDYVDEADGSTQQLDLINASFDMERMDQPLSGEGSARWRGEVVPFKAVLASLGDLMDARPTRLQFQTTAAPVAASYDGSLLLDQGVTLDGTLSAQAVSIKKLAAWFDADLPNAPGFGAGRVNGRLKMAGDRVTLAGTTFEAGGTRGEGDIRMRLGQRVPVIEANLRFAMLDIDGFLRAGGGGGAPASAGGSSDGGETGGVGGVDGIGDLLRDLGGGQQQFLPTSAAQSTASAGRSGGGGWSDEEIDLSGLRLIDVVANIDAERVRVSNLAIGPGRVAARLESGRLTANIADVALYGGRGKGVVTLDARQALPRLGAQLQLDGIAGRPLMKDLVDFDRLDGRGAVAFDVTAQGASERAMVSSLAGPLRIEFRDGAIVGFNVPKILRNLQQGRFDGLQGGSAEKTDFSQLSASFVATKGVLSNNDLELIAPLFRLSGGGTVSMPGRSLDYTVKPRLVANLEGQGSTGTGKGLEIPVRIQGPWTNLSYTPDFAAVLQNPQDAIRAVEDLAGRLKDDKKLQEGLRELQKPGGVDNLLRGLFGGNQ